MSVPRLAKGIARSLGFRLSRDRPQNRFQAVDECLLRMKLLGFEPDVVLDVGANCGQFHRLVRPVYPEARYHLVEPQPACSDALRELAADSRVDVHALALTEPGVDSVRLLGSGPDGRSTGAYVAKAGESSEDAIVVPATTLDGLVANLVPSAKSIFLKLDVEAHELSVLRGACETLTRTEAILIEVSFYDPGSRGNPRFSEIVAYLENHQFLLYDIASLAGRPRDMRLRLGDCVFVRKGSRLLADDRWD